MWLHFPNQSENPTWMDKETQTLKLHKQTILQNYFK